MRLSRRLRQERYSELTPAQLSVLGTIRIDGPRTPSAVATLEHFQPPYMTRIVNHLVEAGLATRDPHPDDGHRVLIAISDKGEAVLAEERANRDQWLARRFAELTISDRRSLRDATVLLENLATT